MTACVAAGGPGAFRHSVDGRALRVALFIFEVRAAAPELVPVAQGRIGLLDGRGAICRALNLQEARVGARLALLSEPGEALGRRRRGWQRRRRRR